MTSDDRHEPRARERRRDLDALRVLAVVVLLGYHSSRPFDTEAWHVKNHELSRTLELMGYVFTPWRLGLLFLISGAGTYFALRTRTAGVYLRDRVTRLLLPLVVGMLVVVPPQVYVERVNGWMQNRMSPIVFEGSFLAFLPHVFDGGPYPRGNLSWHHLWFLLYLFVFSVAALPALVWLKTEKGEATRARMADFLSKRRWIFLPALLLVALHVGLRGRFPPTYALVGDWWSLTHYFVLFVLGYALIPDPRIGAALERHRTAALVAAVALTGARLAVLVSYGAPVPYSAHYAMALTLRGLTEWSALVGVLGYARRYLDRPHPWLAWAADRVPPFYIWHQTAIVLIAAWVIRWDIGVPAKFAVILTASLVVTLALCELIGRSAPSRVLFGMRRRA